VSQYMICFVQRVEEIIMLRYTLWCKANHRMLEADDWMHC